MLPIRHPWRQVRFLGSDGQTPEQSISADCLNAESHQDLTQMHHTCILMHMRSTLNIDDEMLRKAAALTGEKEKTALVRMGLEALIARESGRRLARLGGTEPHLSPARRRRPRPAK